MTYLKKLLDKIEEKIAFHYADKHAAVFIERDTVRRLNAHFAATEPKTKLLEYTDKL